MNLKIKTQFKKILEKLFVLIILISIPAKIWANEKPILIGGKIFTEQSILVDILKLYLKDKSYPIKTNKNLGGTFVAFEALKNGDLDIYVEYTGTAYHTIFKEQIILSDADTFKFLTERLSNFGIQIFEGLGFSNSYSLVVLNNKNKYTKISDLKVDASKLQIGFEHEFLLRPDGYQNLVKAYGLNFLPPRTMNVGLMYEALKNKQLDIGVGYTTDGRNKAFNLKTLKDDLNFFPAYNATILARKEILVKFKNLTYDLSLLSNTINDQEMTEMNYLVDVKKISSLKVARDFLKKKGLIKAKNIKSTSNFLGLKKEEILLLKVKTLEHLKICFIALSIAIILGFILGILAFEFKPLRPPTFTFINLVQTIPSLALFGFLIPFLGIGLFPSLVALILYALLPLVHNIFTGLNEVDHDVIESCQAIGMSRWQILLKVRIPLAMPTISAGLRTSTVIIIGTATIAAFIGAGGLGELIFQGISSLNHRTILLGTIPVALLAFIADFIVNHICKALTSEGLKRKPSL